MGRLYGLEGTRHNVAEHTDLGRPNVGVMPDFLYFAM